jgi:hypothetical protein
MARHRNRRVVITPPPSPPASASAPAAPAPATAPLDVVDFLVRAAVVVLCVIGFVTAARWLAGPQLPDVGWVCWHVERATAAGSERDTRCDPQDGWHRERWPDGAVHAVPDRATVVQRRYVDD